MLLELLLVLLVGKSFSTLIDAVLPHGCIHGRDYFRHLGDHSRKGRDFSRYCLGAVDTWGCGAADGGLN